MQVDNSTELFPARYISFNQGQE
jgi:hypothetical protein